MQAKFQLGEATVFKDCFVEVVSLGAASPDEVERLANMSAMVFGEVSLLPTHGNSIGVLRETEDGWSFEPPNPFEQAARMSPIKDKELIAVALNKALSQLEAHYASTNSVSVTLTAQSGGELAQKMLRGALAYYNGDRYRVSGMILNGIDRETMKRAAHLAVYGVPRGVSGATEKVFAKERAERRLLRRFAIVCCGMPPASLPVENLSHLKNSAMIGRMYVNLVRAGWVPTRHPFAEWCVRPVGAQMPMDEGGARKFFGASEWEACATACCALKLDMGLEPKS
jgi:hypothetical protein